MKELLVLLFAFLLLTGCAVTTPYGTSFYAPVPEIAVAPYPYAYSYYPYSYYPFSYPYFSPWYSWRSGCGSCGYSYRSYGHGGPYRHHYRH